MIDNTKPSFFKDQIFLFLFGLGVVVSLQMAWVEGFFPDGYLYASFGKNAAFGGYWSIPHLSQYDYPRFEQHLPTLFILEGVFFKLFGASYLTARVFISLFFLATGVAVYRWAIEKEDRIFAYYSLFLFFTIPPLIKKTRFPNLDIPLMCTIFYGFYYYSKVLVTQKRKDWIILGLFFGFSMLIKGPVGWLLPIAIFSHLLITRKLLLLMNPWPWFALLIGFFFFSLWPFFLYMNDQFQVFLDWYKFTFIITIKKSRGIGQPFWTYFIFLIKQTSIWFLLAFVGFYFNFKKNDTFKLCFLFFISILVFLSIPKFKYSNYLIPLYPFLSLSAAYGFRSIGKSFYPKVYRGIPLLVFSLTLTLLVFPLTNKGKRDFEIRYLKLVLKSTNTKVNRWVNVNGSYSGVGLASLLTWEEDALVSSDSLDVILSKWGPGQLRNKIIVSLVEDYKKLKDHFPELEKVLILKNNQFIVSMHKKDFNLLRPLSFRP